MDADPTPPRDVTIFKKEIKRNKKEIKFETPRAPRILIFRKFLSYIQKRNNWKGLKNDETPRARWCFTKGIILNYIIWYKDVCVITTNNFQKKEIISANAVLSRTFAKNKKKLRKHQNNESLRVPTHSTIYDEFLFCAKKEITHLTILPKWVII